MGVAQRNIHKQDVVSRSSNKCWIIRRRRAGRTSRVANATARFGTCRKCGDTARSQRDIPRSVASQALLMCSEYNSGVISSTALLPLTALMATNVESARGDVRAFSLRPVMFRNEIRRNTRTWRSLSIYRSEWLLYILKILSPFHATST